MEFQLIDDGTLDTVVAWECPHCQDTNRERFSQEYAATYRDDEGVLDLDGLMAEFPDLYCGACDRGERAAAVAYIEQRLGYALNSLRHPADRGDIDAARDNINEALGYLRGYFKGELI